MEKKCGECGQILKPSQHARLKQEGQPANRSKENLVCRNYPNCPMAEKEIENRNNR